MVRQLDTVAYLIMFCPCSGTSSLILFVLRSGCECVAEEGKDWYLRLVGIDMKFFTCPCLGHFNAETSSPFQAMMEIFSVGRSLSEIKLSPGQTRKHCCGNIVSCQRFVMFPTVGKLGNIF